MSINLNLRTKKLDFIDFKLEWLCGVVVGIVLARYRLELLDISVWWWITLAILLALRPLYRFWIKTE